MLSTCATCGEPCHGTYCYEHKPADSRTKPSRAAGYDAAWDRLSKRVRKLQPFCLDCGTRDDLTADHLPSAWERKALSLPLRVVDVEVVCRSCNSKRGAARGDSASLRESPRGVGVNAVPQAPLGQGIDSVTSRRTTGGDQ